MFKIFKIALSIILCLVLTSVSSMATNYLPKGKNTNIEKHLQKDKVKNGLRGDYYGNANFTNLRFTRIDQRVSFDWEGEAPDRISGNDSFSIRWSGQVQPRYTEYYTFHVIADDGVRLWINNQLVINDWNDHAATETDGTISLEANKKYDIRLDYYENRNDACVKLLWSSSSQTKEIIPKERLFSQTGGTVQPPVNPPVNDREPLKVELSAYYNEDAFSYDSKRSDGDYDGWGCTYPADLFSSNPSFEGTAYITGPLGNGYDNSVCMDGQTISVNQNKCKTICILGSSTNGSQSGYVRVNYTDGSYGWLNLAMKDWCAGDTSGERIARSMSHRHSGTADENISNYVFAYYLTPDKSKTISSITLPDQNDMHMLAMTLLPEGQNRSGTGNGLYGQYFDNLDFTSPKLNRTDAAVNFDWAQGSPTSSMESDSFSIRWTGQVEPRYSETYTFYTVADDGVRLWVNNTLLIDDWSEHSATERSAAITLNSDTKYNIKLEYFEKYEKASVKLMWSSYSQSKEIIPTSQLYN